MWSKHTDEADVAAVEAGGEENVVGVEVGSAVGDTGTENMSDDFRQLNVNGEPIFGN